VRQQARPAKRFGSEADFGELFYSFQSLIGDGQVLPAGHHAVILEQNRIKFRR
jgi:hypothetical protein